MSRPLNPAILDDIQNRVQARGAFDQQGLKESVLGAPPITPDGAAQSQDLSGQTGIPAPTVARNMELVRTQSQTQQLPYAKVAQQTPKLNYWLQNPSNLAVSKDDLHQMGTLEWLMQKGGDFFRSMTPAYGGIGVLETGLANLNDVVVRDVQKGLWFLTNKIGVGESWAAEQGAPLPVWADPSGALRYHGEQVKKTAEDLGVPKERQNLFTEIVGSVSGILPLMAATMVDPGVGLAALYGTGAGGETAAPDGASQESKDLNTLMQATIMAGTGEFGLGKLFDRVSPSLRNTVMRHVVDKLEAGLIQAGVVTGQSTLSNLSRKLTTNPAQPLFEGADRQAVVGFATGVILRSILGASPEFQARTRAVETENFYKAIGEGVTNSKTFKRLPESVRRFLVTMEDGKAATTYIPAESWQSYHQERGFDPIAAAEKLTQGGSEKFQDALASGSDFAVPTADYAVRIAPDPEANGFFSQEARLDPTMMNTREAKAAGENTKAELQRMVTEAQNTFPVDSDEYKTALAGYDSKVAAATPEELPALQAERDRFVDRSQKLTTALSAQAVGEDIRGQLTGQGVDQFAVDANAMIHQAVFGSLGERAGMDPKALFDQYGLTITRPLPEMLSKMSSFDPLDLVLNRIRSGDVPSPSDLYGPTLMDFLRSKGGVKDSGGDLASMELDKYNKPFQKKFIQPKTGVEMDRARMAALEAGYDVGDDLTTFKDAIDSEARGTPVYSRHAEESPQFNDAMVLQQTSDFLKDSGIDLTKMTNEQVKKIMSDIQSMERSGNGVAFEQRDEEGYDAMSRRIHQDVMAKQSQEMTVLGISSMRLHDVISQNSNLGFDSDSAAVKAIKADPSILNKFEIPGLHEAATTYLEELARIKKLQENREPNPGLAYFTKQADFNLELTKREKQYRLIHGELRSDARRELARNLEFEQFLKDNPGMGIKEFEQRAGGIARGKFTPTPGRFNIQLLRSADLSTFAHESGHMFLEVFGDLADHLKAQDPATLTDSQKQIVSDYAKVLKWLGVENRAGIETAHHEQWARGIEAYLREGKAPSVELRSTFARFRAWLQNLYKTLDRLGPDYKPTSAEVNGVMDRLFATDRAIAEARAESEVTPIFMEKPEWMGDAQWKAYQDVVEEASRAAQDSVQQKLLGQQQRMHAEWWKSERSKLREEVAHEVGNRADYRALSILQRGQLPDGSEYAGAFKLDKDAILKKYGKEFLKSLPRPYVYTVEGGIHPDMAANILGFRSGEEMLHALAGLKDRPLAAFIDAHTDQMMQERHPDAMNDGSLAEVAKEAVMTEGRGEVLHAEAMALAHGVREHDPFVRAALKDQKDQTRAERTAERDIFERFVPKLDAVRHMAESQIADTKIRDITPNLFFAAARRASKQATDALLSNNFPLALKWKQTELINTERYRAALSAHEQVDGAIEQFKKFFRPDGKIAPARDLDYVQAARAIVAQYVFPRYQSNVNAALETIKANDPDLYDVLREKIETALDGGTSYKDLTFERFTAMRDAALSLWNMAKREGQVRIDGKLISKKVAVSYLNDQIATHSQAFKGMGLEGLPSRTLRLEKAVLGLKAHLRRMESFVTAMDGGDSGPFRTYIWNPVKDSINAFRVEKVSTLTEYKALLDPIQETLTADKIAAPELGGYTFGNDGSGGMAELLGALLHTGNRNDPKSNMAKLLVGRGWGQYADVSPLKKSFRVQGTLDTTRWDGFIDRMQKEGRLTSAHYDFVQGVWDLFESLKPGLQKSHKDVYGMYFNEIPADGFEALGKTYRGGYVPALIDPTLSKDAEIRAEKMVSMEGGSSFVLPSAGRKSTISRVKTSDALAMNLAFIPSHIDWALRFAHIQPAVKDVQRILQDRAFRDAMGAHDPEAIKSMVTPWLQRAATQRLAEAGKSPTFDKFMNAVRANTGLQVLTANVGNALQQLTGGLVGAVKIENKAELAGSAYRYFKAPGETAEFIRDQSSFMNTFLTSQAMEIQRSVDNILLNPSTYAKSKQFLKEYSSVLTEGTQNIVNHVVWSAAYNEAIAKGMDAGKDGKAVHHADAVVRQTQGTFFPEDVSRFEANTPTIRALTMFSSYFNMLGNLLTTESGNALRSDRGSFAKAGRLLSVYTLGFMLPAVVSQAILSGMSGNWEDDGDDTHVDELLNLFVGAQAHTAFASLPIVGTVGNAAYNAAFTDSSYDDDIRISPTLGMLTSGLKDVAQRVHGSSDYKNKLHKQEARDFLSIMGLMTGLPLGPLGKPFGYWLDVHEGKTKPKTGLDVVRGAVTGRSPQKTGAYQ